MSRTAHLAIAVRNVPLVVSSTLQLLYFVSEGILPFAFAVFADVLATEHMKYSIRFTRKIAPAYLFIMLLQFLHLPSTD